MAISSSSTGLRPGVCTSTTRPTAPYTGMVIMETDTGYLRVWDGAAWDYFLPKQDNIPGVWTSYTPVWTSSGTAPSVGNATVSGKYAQIGKIVFAEARFIFGSTTTFGTGQYFFSLPVAANPLWGYQSQGIARIWDLSAANTYLTQVAFYNASSGATTVSIQTGGTSNWAAATVPMTFANGDEVQFTLTYEAQ